jgi:peroxiredoxin
MRRARRNLLIAALASASLPAALAVERKTFIPWAAPETPALDLLRPNGEPLSLASLRGKVVLVNFWATWCEPCIAEMPSLQALRDQLAWRGFEVLGVNYQEGPARIDSFVRKAGIVFPIVRDTDGAAARAWNARVFPTSFLVDRSGRVRYALVGEADWTSQELLSTIDALLVPQLKS